MKKFSTKGYHIARSAINPKTDYLGKNNKYVGISDALLFLDHLHARNYANKNGIELGDAHNVIVPCECSKYTRQEHPIANSYH